PAPPLRIALVQGNIEQSQKWDPAYRRQVLEVYEKLSAQAAEQGVDLIVWPEASTPFFFGLDKTGSRAVEELARNLKTPLLIGSPRLESPDPGATVYNSAYLVEKNGGTAGRYDKMHLVPFGEFVPFREVLFFVEKMVETIGNFGRGTEATVFNLDGRRFGVSICYEITFPWLVRQPVARGAGFLVNITNDAWFGKSAASYQHFSMAALRAVENRVPIVRAANTGITGWVDVSGRIRQPTGLFVQDVVIARITPNTGPRTYYARYGDVFSWACLLSLIAFAARARKLEPVRADMN
ncbi:MAG: apolipoprotein N-acyltransferase, partial [Nitrospinae bacterium CG11_big_fil_rev_8_21_14_0_20_56_8]